MLYIQDVAHSVQPTCLMQTAASRIRGSGFPHRRQFVLCRNPVEYRGDWPVVQLEGGFYLCHCPSLPVQIVTDKSGVQWCLLGIAVQTEPERDDPDEEIRLTPTTEITSRYDSWAGRWMLIGNGEIHLDASGLLACYYMSPAIAVDQVEVLVSSSPALLTELGGRRVGDLDPRKLPFSRGINWFPPPRSQYSLVRHLLPSQVLRLEDRVPRERPLHPGLIESPSYDQALELLAKGLVTFMRRLSGLGRKLWLPVSGGVDSRVLLAAVVKSKVEASTFTFEYKSMALGDRLFPRRLARMSGLPYLWIPMGRPNPNREAAFDAHTGGNMADSARLSYIGGQFDFGAANDLILHGGCFEVGRCYYWKKFPQPEPIPDASQIVQVLEEDAESSATEGFREWLDWVRRTPHAGLDWRDRLYWEQRLTGWRSAGEQAMDLAVDRVHPINSRLAFSLLLSIPWQTRLASRHESDLVRMMAPDLCALPFNPECDYFGPHTRFYWNCRSDLIYPLKWLRRRVCRLLRIGL